MSQELNRNLNHLNRWHLLMILYLARWLYLKQRMRLPMPISFAIMASLSLFVLLSVLPHHLLAIPIAIGGGLSGGLLLIGGRYVPTKSTSNNK
jgi:hypothetical protein